MSRLPGHASASERVTPHSTPCRSTTAAHILLGANKPPLLFGGCTTDASLASTLLTTDGESEQAGCCPRLSGSFPWLFCAKAPVAPAVRMTAAAMMDRR